MAEITPETGSLSFSPLRRLLSRAARERFYRKNPAAKWAPGVALLVSLVSSGIGLIHPVAGFVASGVLAFATYYLLPPAYLLVEKITVTREEA